METSSDFRFSKVFTIVAAVLLLTTSLGFSSVQAQQSLQVDVLHIPPVLPTPFVSDFEHQVRGGRYQLQVNYTGATTPVEVEFEFRMFKDRELIVEEVSEPATVNPGFQTFAPIFDHLNFEAGFDDVVSGLSRDLQSTFIQTGAFPEGRYRVEVDAHPVDRQMNVTAGRADFEVRYPQPPRITSPADGSDITQTTPVLSWSPVMGAGGFTMEYEVLIVELFDGQSPEEAIDANRPQLHTTVMDATSLVYTQQFLPLEEGVRYAIQVTAHEINDELPISNEGESEIHTFTFMDDDVEPGDLADLEEIILVPDAAVLTDLVDIEAEETGEHYELTGTAVAEIDLPDLRAPVEIEAELQGLRIQQTNLDDPVITGGSVQMQPDPLNEALGERFPAEFSELRYEFDEGLWAEGSVRTEFFGAIEAESDLFITPAGLEGSLTATAEDVVEYRSDPVSFALSEITVSFPQTEITADGYIDIDGIESPCNVYGLDINSERLRSGFYCENMETTPLVDDQQIVMLEPGFLRGEIIINQENETFSFDITKDAEVTVNQEDGDEELCYTHFQMDLDSDEGINVRPVDQRCDYLGSGLNLGFAEIFFREPQLNQMEINEEGEWDFELSFDCRLEVKLFDGWESPWLENTVISRSGISFEEHEFTREAEDLPNFELADIKVHLQQILVEHFDFPLFQREEWLDEPSVVAFEGQITFPNSSSMPTCLNQGEAIIENGELAVDGASADISVQSGDDCEWEFGAGYAVNVDAISGHAGAEWELDGDETDITPYVDLGVHGDLIAGDPFECLGENPDQNIELQYSGGLHGVLENVHPDCPVGFGPFTGEINESLLELDWSEEEGQEGVLGGEMGLQFSRNIEATGDITIDIMEGEIKDGELVIDGPFYWDIPDEDEVLTFRLEEATLSADGLFIDGRHDFVVGDEEMGVTFDQVLLGLETLQIEEGEIIFDERFALEAGITSDDDLEFSAIPADTTTMLDPGLYMELGTVVTVDSAGIGTEGTAEAEVYYEDKGFDSDLTVEYSDDFHINLYPFEVTSGRADFYLNDSRIAYVDSEGFHPNFAYFAEMLIPEKLPLPTESVAYIRLRDEDDEELLVDASETEDGEYAISTKPDESLTLYVPAWDKADPPEVVDVQLEDVVVGGDPSSPVMVEGSVTADVDPGDELHDLTERDIPLQLNRLVYGEAQPENDNPFSHLYFEGHLYLFEEELDEPGEAGLYLDHTGKLEADLDIDGFEQPIPLMPGSETVVYTLTSLEGNFDTDLDGLTDPDFDFSLGGLFEVNDDENIAASTALDLNYNTAGVSVAAFDGDIDDMPNFDIGFFELGINEINKFPKFAYSEEDGFEFEVGLDLDLYFNPAEGESFYFPLEGVEIRNDGLVIPSHNIDASSEPGLDLPEFEFLDMEIKPLAIRITEDFVANWYEEGWSFDLEHELDFELRLPEFEGTALDPPDGITFNNVGFEEGYLTGSVQTHEPVDAELPLIPGYDDTPILMVDSLGGSFEREVIDGEPGQDISLYAHIELYDIPTFEPPEDDCPEEPNVELEIIDGSGLEGSLSDYSPCGEVEMGPVALSVTDANLHITYVDDEQSAWVGGTMEAVLPAPNEQEITATGTGEVDLLTGAIRDGEITITDEFTLGYGHPDDPPISLTMSQATLDSSGLEITGSGSAGTDDVSVDVTFNEFLFALPEFYIADGEATLQPNLAMQVATDLTEFTISEEEDDLEGNNVFRYVADQEISITPDGISFSGSGTASLVYQGEDYFDMDLNFEDEFAINIGGNTIAATQGRAEAYLTEGESPDDFDDEEPFVIWDVDNGLSIGGGILAVLPDRLGLPTEDIAYVDLVDEDGEELVDLENLDGGGYELSTGDDTLPVVIPALEGDDSPPSVDVGFSLETDDEYNLVDGDFTLEEGDEYDLGSQLDLPVTLTGLDIGSDDGDLYLEASILADLPSVFEGHDATGTLVLDQADGIEATVEAGTYTDTWDESLEGEHLYEYAHDDDLGGEDDDLFAARLYGIEIQIGSDPEMGIAAGLESSIITPPEEDGSHTLFLAAAYEDGDWDGTAAYDWPHESTDIGFVEFLPEEHEAVSVDMSEDEFIVGFNGIIDFEDMIGEDFLIDVDDLQVGVDGISNSPGLVFDIGEATAEMPDQEFDLFEGALAGEFSGISVGITQRALELSSEDGEIEFLEQDLEYDEFMISTAGEFSIDNIGTGGFDLFEDYVALDGLGVSYDEEDGVELASNFTVTLPEPVEEDAAASVMISRDNDGQISVDAEGPEFDFEDEKFPLGDFAEFRLDDASVGLEVTEPFDSYFYANGAVLIDEEERIKVGDPGNEIDEAGISFKPSRATSPLRYNVEGNQDFDFDHSFFSITIHAQAVANNDGGDQSEFKLELGGEAGIDIQGVSGEIGYEGFIVTAEGVEDIGNFDGNGKLTLMEFAELEIGQFYYESDDDGFEVTVGGTEEEVETDDDYEEGQVGDELDDTEPETIEVTRILCFGDHPEIEVQGDNGCGGGNDALQLSLGGEGDSGGFESGIGGLLFYETKNGGTRRIEMDDIFLEVSQVLEVSGSMQYESDAEGMMLRLAAIGSFEVGSVDGVSAMVAGTFENRDGLSFGLFAAASVEALSVPILPPVVEAYGFGGGFFYDPSDEDIDFVHAAIEDFGHELVDPDAAPSAGDDVTGFATMLYAEIGVAGAAGATILDGQAFLQFTNQGMYIDVQGQKLGLDGSPAGLEYSAGAYLSVEMDLFDDPSFDEFLLQGGLVSDLSIPVYLDGQGEITFFAGKTEESEGFVWGIQGSKDIDIFGGMLTTYTTFLASDIGFYFDGGFDAGLDVAIIDFEAALHASVWYTLPDADIDLNYPLGGYGSANAELCVRLLGCAGVEVNAAVAQHHEEGLEMFGAASAEIASRDVSGWVSVTSGPEVDYGLGESDEADMISEVQGYKDEFEDYIAGLLDELDAAQEAIEEFDIQDVMPSDELVEEAGYNLFAMNEFNRSSWADQMRDNEESSGRSLPSILDAHLSIYLESGLRDNVTTPRYSKDIKESIMELLNFNIEEVSGDVTNTLTEALEEAEEIQEMTETAYADMLDALEDSPVESWDTVSTGNYKNQAPGYDLNEQVANEQAENAEDLEELMDEMGMAMIEPIQEVESLIEGMDAVMYEQDSSSLDLYDFTLDMNPSVFGYAKMYNDLIHFIDRLHVAKANRSWVGANRADNRLPSLEMIGNAIDDEVEDMTSVLINYWGTHQFEDEAAITANRLNILYHLKNDRSHSAYQAGPTFPKSEAQELYDGLTENHDVPPPAGVSPPDENDLTELNKRLWYDMFELGYEEYIRVQEDYLANEVFASHQDVREPMVEAHQSLTNQIEQFYDMQANTVSTLYAMIDNFVYRFESVENVVSDDVAEYIDEYSDRHSEVAEMLQPPEINSITVSPDRPSNNFYNMAEITWSASHPQEVIETSVQVTEDTPGVIQLVDGTGSSGDDSGISYGIDEYVSIGQDDEYQLITTRTSGLNFNWNDFNDPNFNTKNINMGLQVRGPAGTTAIRRATFELDVGPGGESVDDGYNPLPDEEDIDPPDEPIAELDQVLGYNDEAAEPAYWTNNPQLIDIQARARDSETGIDEIEYAIGTEAGEDDIVEWSTLPGVLEFVDGGYEQISGESVAFDLEEDEDYYVSLRAINNAGMTSPELNIEDPVRYDDTEPSGVEEDEFDDSMFSVLGFDPVIQLITTATFDPVFESPSFFHDDYSLDNLPDSPRIDPKTAVKWTEATDEVSGVSHYEYTVTDSEAISDAEFAMQESFTTDDLSAVLKGGEGNPFEDVITNFEDEVYAHVRAVDYAGNTGEILSMERVAYDAYNPVSPIIQVRPKEDEFDLFVTGPFNDPESGIKGIQYSVGTSAGETDIRDWPEGDEVDFEYDIDPFGYYIWPPIASYSITTDKLTEGEEVYINYRSVNNQGRISNTRNTGPVVLDTEPPETPVIAEEEIGYDNLTGMFTISFEAENIHDPVSGVIEVEYRLKDGNETTGWVNLESYDEPETDEITIDHFTHIPNTLDSDETSVEIRVTNAMQMQTTGPQFIVIDPDLTF